MDLRRLSIRHFRNFGRVEEIELPRGGLLVAAAANATGKTNFLESVAVLLRGKSFRAGIEDCVAWGQEDFMLHGTLTDAAEIDHSVAVRYQRPTRTLSIKEDGVPASVVSFYSQYPFVAFLPEDTFLFDRGPAVRRSFLNQVLVSHQQYVSALVQYHRVLRQRNMLLRRLKGAGELDSWTELLAEHADTLWRHREGLVTFFDDQLTGMYQRLSGEKLQVRMVLRRDAMGQAELLTRLTEARATEARSGYTLYGPHRDDVMVMVDGHAVHGALSRGQTRTLVAALKFLAHGYIKQTTGEEPLLLLDDVLSEMDENRQRVLLAHLPATQVLLTCTAVPAVLRERQDVYLLDLRSIVDRAMLDRRRHQRAVVEEGVHAEVSRQPV